MKQTGCLILATILLGGWPVQRASAADSFSAAPVADAFVATGPTDNLSGNNYGGGGALAVAAPGLPNGEFQTVMRFDTSSLLASLNSQFGAGQWTIQSVSLRLSSSPHNNAIYNNPAPGLFSVALLQNSSWVEGTGNASNPASTGITYNSLLNTFVNPAADQPLGTFSFPGGTSGINTYALALAPQLTSGLATGSSLSLRLFAADNRVSYLFSSRSGNSSDQPQLLITAIPEPSSLALLIIGLGFLLSRARTFARARSAWAIYSSSLPVDSDITGK
jgi:hypothetical protein